MLTNKNGNQQKMDTSAQPVESPITILPGDGIQQPRYESMTDLVLLVDPTVEEPEESETKAIERSITMSNQEWSILAMCAEAYATTFRTQQSEFIATYVTRGQLDEAVNQAEKMNSMLQKLDKLQAALM